MDEVGGEIDLRLALENSYKIGGKGFKSRGGIELNVLTVESSLGKEESEGRAVSWLGRFLRDGGFGIP